MITLAETKQLNNLALATTLVIIDPNVTNPQQLAAGVMTGAAVKILDAHRDGIIQISEILQAYPNVDSLHLVSHGSPGCIHLGNSKLNLDTLPLYAAKIENWFSSFPPSSSQSLECLHKLHLSPPAPKFGGEDSLKSSSIGNKTVQKYHDQVQNKESCPANFRRKSSKSPRIGGFRGHDFITQPKLLIYGCNVAQGESGQKFLNKLQQLTQAQIQASSTKIGNAELGGNWQLDIAVGDNSEADNAEIIFNQETQQAYSGIFDPPVANDDPIPYPAEIELSSLDGSNGFVINGIDADDESGISVSSAGDVNGDGLADLIIGAPNADPNGNYSGESYVVFGSSNLSSSIDLSALDGSNGFVLNGIDANGYSGRSVSGAGDVNGDGLADLIIGAYAANGAAGESYVVFGSSNSSSSIDLSALDGSNGFVLNGIDGGDQSGISVSGAGDVNGDGLADLIIGAYGANSFAGESYVVFGSSNPSSAIELSALNGSNGFVLNGIDGGDNSGFSVSSAGDVNGDGLADIIIGAYGANSYAGESYVVFGSSNPSSSIDLSALDGSNGFVLNGININDRSGRSVSSVGDVNGDGIADIIIGAYRANSNAGESYVVFGSSNPSSSIDLSALDGSNGFVLNGIDANDYSGGSVSSVRDVNGDGIADIIIGAYRANSNAGESYVVFGSSNPSSSIDLSALDGSNGFVLNGIDANDYSGGSVSDAGDVNGDGTADLIIGANQADPNGNGEAGESYVVFGRDFNTDEDTSFTTSSVLFNDTDADGDPLSVTAIETTGTLGLVTNNGDGTFNYDPNGQFDFLKPGETASDTFIYTVTANGETDTATVTITITGIEDAPVANDDSIIFSAAIELSALNGNNGFVLNGINLGDNSGYSVSNAGDVNGDGIDDVIIGAPFTDINNNNEGESYVVFGDSNVGSSGTIELSALDGSNGFVLKGIDAYDNSGRSVSNAGDINGDGTADLIISADRADTSSGYTGESYVVFGSSDVGSLGTIELSALDGSNGFVLNGIDERDYSSYSVSNAGDVNGDGLDDLIIGAFRADPNGNGSGESYVVFGGSDVGSSGTIELSVLDGSNGFIINGIDPTDYSGRSVSNAGDVNGDGFADLIISARSANPNGSQSGESYVVFGGSDVGNSGTIELSSLDGSNGFVLNGIERSDQSGESISNAGDINGDGIDDLIIGAPFADPVSDAEGESYVVFGSTNLGSSGTIELSSLDGSNGFILNGIDEDDRSGYSVSNAGDVNGDGTDDLIIGALYGDPNGNDEGESYVVFGGSDVGSSGTIELSSLDGSNGFVLNGIDDGDQLGVAVSNAGDINGDGTPDLIIGADRADPNGSGSGESYVIFGRDFSTDEDTIFNTSSVLFNDTDADGDTLTVTSIDTTSTLGLVLNNGDGTFNYDPDGRFDSLSAGETATDTFTYTISDGDQTDTATVTITIDGINDAPIATTDKFSTDEDTAFTTDDVLANDSDPEGDSFTLESIDTTSTLGLVTDNGNGTFDYDPNGQFEFLEPGEFATDSFGYKLVDSNGAIAHGTVKIVIDGIDDDNTKDDLFLGTAKDDSIWGSAADDTIMGLDGNDTLNGEAGNDSLRGLDDHDSLAGNNGDDTLKGGTGNDILAGGNDNDSLNGDSGNDTLLGDTGSDTLAGQSGADSLNGGDDDDSLVGANGIDTLDGGLGNDTLLGQGDPDLLFGQDGDDSLVGGDGDDTLDGGVGNDTLLGQNEADLLFGQENNDRLLGQDGNDTLYGGSGDDTLLGQNNDDVLFGGLGLDSLTGGLGNDRFAIVSGDTVDQDIITDFQDGLDELLLTGGLTFGKLTISQNGSDTDIIETSSSQTLATLINIDAIDIDETDFV